MRYPYSESAAEGRLTYAVIRFLELPHLETAAGSWGFNQVFLQGKEKKMAVCPSRRAAAQQRPHPDYPPR